jgi:Fe-S cluster biosynthesis and repair protein YggX
MATNTLKFIQAFDAENERHVNWLARMITVAETMGDTSKQISLVNEINLNPMNVELEHRDALDWPHIHFCLCAVYSKAVLRGKAYVPTAVKERPAA